MNFEDMSTRKLKRQYFKWIKSNWRRQHRTWDTSQEKAKSRENVRRIKVELARRDWDT